MWLEKYHLNENKILFHFIWSSACSLIFLYVWISVSMISVRSSQKV